MGPIIQAPQFFPKNQGSWHFITSSIFPTTPSLNLFLPHIYLFLLPQNKMLLERIVGAGAFDEGVENSIKFILHGLS
jgi:hypothetical protein